MTIISENDLINSLNISNGNDVTFLLGAGCSILSGCMPASKLVREFKKRIYCVQHGINLNNDIFLDDRKFDEILNNEFDDLNIKNPYSYYFEKCFPEYYDRNKFIKDYFQDVKPSFGYYCFADYLVSKKVKNIMTTNFDLLIERSIRKIDDTYDFLNVSDNETPLLNGETNIIKLHGDYNYDHIKNTEYELKKLSEQLYSSLMSTKFKKLVIIGYSGQDDSIMNFLNDYVASHKDVIIYWCGLEDCCSSSRVNELLSISNSYYVKISGFDSLFIRYYKFAGSKNEFLNNFYKVNYEKNNFDLIPVNQKESFKFNSYRINGNPIVYKTTEIIDDSLLETVYFYKSYKENTYLICNSYFINKLNRFNIVKCSLSEEKIPLNIKCKLIKELIKWHCENIGLSVYKDNIFKESNNLIKDGLKVNVDLFNGDICLIINPNYFIPQENLNDYQKSQINFKKSNLYTKQNWNYLDEKLGLFFNHKLTFGDNNINVSFYSENTCDNLKNIYDCCNEPIMCGDNSQSVNQIKILDLNGPKKIIFSTNKIKVGIFCCEEDKEQLENFLYDVQNGINSIGTELIPTYKGFKNIFNKDIEFIFDALPMFKSKQMMGKDIKSIVDFYIRGLNKMYNEKQVDLALIYVSKRLAWIRNNEELDFHNIIKLKSANKYKTQFLEESTILSNDNKSKILFNFAIGIYTKTIGMPWYPLNYSKETLFLGLSFGRDSKGITVGCSQMFDGSGRGMQLIISQISEKKTRKNQYLTEDEAYELGKKIRQTYYRTSKVEELKRIVIHRSDPFKDEEIEGFKKAFEGIDDFVLLQIIEDTSLNIYPFTNYGCGMYPAKRGTIIKSSNDIAYIWTDGSVNEADVNGGKTYRNSKRGMGRPLKVKKFYP